MPLQRKSGLLFKIKLGQHLIWQVTLFQIKDEEEDVGEVVGRYRHTALLSFCWTLGSPVYHVVLSEMI